MKTYSFAALCAVFLLFCTAGCGTPRAKTERKGRWVAPQTGSVLPRWVESSRGERDNRAAQRKAKAKRDKQRAAKKPKTEKPKRDRAERDEEVITRSGFR